MMNSATTAAGRVAVVTGSNKGIGFYIALQLGMSGLFEHVLLACRDAGRAQTAVESLRAQLPASVQVSAESLTLGDTSSHQALADTLDRQFSGKIDVLVNNAALAFKNADPTPFAEQTKPTLDVNFRGTVDLTNRLLPLLRRGNDARVVSVASMAGRLSQLSPTLQEKFSSPTLTMDELQQLVNDFESAVQNGTHKAKGWGNSNYGLSKLAVIAATKVWARDEAGKVSFNCCCPGYCKTDMSSQRGSRDPAEGAKNAVIPATMENPPTGAYFSDYEQASW